jgi:amino acid adenylation domain-containing protein
MNIDANVTCRPLHAGFFDRAELHPGHIALDFGDKVCKYGELRELSLRIANTIETYCDDAGATRWIGMLASKTKQGYASILGILCSGKGYLPLSCDSPVSRLVDMIKRGEVGFLLVDDNGLKLLKELLVQLDSPLIICVVAEGDSVQSEVRRLADEFEQHTFASVSTVAKDPASLNQVVQSEAPAYLLFTSGSTGRPKGVVVSHGNVRFFMNYMIDRYKFTSKDRFSQNFDFTFDLSVFDIFVSLEVGACICPPNVGDKILPKRYINRSKLTVWFSVPSVVNSMQAAKQLSSGVFDNLRYSLFCGEALAVKAARLWQAAAANSELVNLYGPTEATICCTAYTWAPLDNKLQDECIVPIGKQFSGLSIKVLDEELLPVADGKIGELWIGGPQVALGYLDDPSETQLRFAYDEYKGCRFYRTGDRVFYDTNGGNLCFVGRVDHQVKIRGYRIELGEVEQALRACCGGANVIAVPWPPEGLHEKLVAVMDAGSEGAIGSDLLLSKVRRYLPEYMVPSAVVCVEKLPLNGNGKIDRRATLKRLTEEWS